MRTSDQYHKWVQWSEEDQVYVGRCPDLIMGIHGDDPLKVYGELCELVEEVIGQFESEGRSLPAPRVRPMREVVWCRKLNRSLEGTKPNLPPKIRDG